MLRCSIYRASASGVQCRIRQSKYDRTFRSDQCLQCSLRAENERLGINPHNLVKGFFQLLTRGIDDIGIMIPDPGIADETVEFAETLYSGIHCTNVVCIAGYIAFNRKNFTAKVFV